MSLALHRIKIRSNDLRLREDAPFPSEVEDAQHAIRQWRHEQMQRFLDCNIDTSTVNVDDEEEYEHE